MAEVIVRFFTPDGIAATIAAWRIAEPYGHAVLIIDDVAYSSQIPWVEKYPVTHPRIAMPPREGVDFSVHVTDEQKMLIKEWCELRLGTWYDMLGILGWFFYFGGWHSPTNTYCFEFCREAFEAVGILSTHDRMVTGYGLMLDLLTKRID